MAFDPLGKVEIEQTNEQVQLLLATLTALARENAPKVDEILTNLAALTRQLSLVAAKLNTALK